MDPRVAHAYVLVELHALPLSDLRCVHHCPRMELDLLPGDAALKELDEAQVL